MQELYSMKGLRKCTTVKAAVTISYRDKLPNLMMAYQPTQF